MSRKGLPGEGMNIAPPDTGPFRKTDYDYTKDDTTILTEMQMEIAAEGNLSVELPKNIRVNKELPHFAETCEAIDPKNITLWSLTNGLLWYSEEEPDKWGKKISYTYRNRENPDVMVIVELPAKENPIKSLLKKETPPAIIVKLVTKADIERKNQELPQDPIQILEKKIETATEEELWDLKIDLARLLSTIEKKFEEKK